MTKNLKLSFLLVTLASAIMMAWRTLYSFFGGVGINFVAMLVIVVVLTLVMLTDKFVLNRTKDLFIVTCALTCLELLVYFAFEFVVKDYSHLEGFLVYQNILSIIGIFFFAYISFRFITEFKGVKIGFIEFMLGNEKPVKKHKKDKELANGTLEEKPNSKKEEMVEEFTSKEVEETETITEETNEE